MPPKTTLNNPAMQEGKSFHKTHGRKREFYAYTMRIWLLIKKDMNGLRSRKKFASDRNNRRQNEKKCDYPLLS